MSMSFADVVPFPVAGGCVQEGSVGLQRSGGASCTGEVLREGGEVLQAGPVSGEGAIPEGGSRSLAEQLGLSTLAMGLASAALGGATAGEVVSCGFRELDRLLPSGGIRRGSLVEWLPAGVDAGLEQAGDRQGSGVVTFAMAVAAQVVRAAAEGAGGATTVLVVDRPGWFYPPAVTRWLGAGRDPFSRVQLVVVRPSRDDDEVWAIDQALRCAGVAAVVACPSAAVVCANVMRRWQLAARGSSAVGMLVRPWQSRRDPSWAEVRLVATPLRRPVASGNGMPRGRGVASTAAGLPADAAPRRQLRAPPVAPRSEAVLRWWRIERLSSLLHGEGASCEVVMDLERGVEAAAVRQVAGKAFFGSVLRKDGVSCRAS